MSDASVAYVGTGIMGGAMACNLLRAGVPLVAHNRTRAKAEALVERGARVADSPSEATAMLDAGAAVRVLFLNVPDTPDVERVLFGEGGVVSADADALRDLIVVDHSTICPIETARFAERLAEHGVTLIDAPVSGGDVGARQGTLTIMCGGPSETYERVLPLLRLVGKQVTLLGPAGSGQACKACNQVAAMGCLAGACEALALAKRSGLDLNQVIEVLAGGAATSWQLENLGPKIALGDHDPGFKVALLLKDLGLVAGAAAGHELPMPVTSEIQALFHSIQQGGKGEAGTQALASAYERLGDFLFTQ